MSDIDDTVRDGRFLNTPYRRGDEYKYHLSSSLGRHYDRLWYHPYKKSDRKYMPNEFKKAKPRGF